MFPKELTQWRNQALKKSKEIFQESPELSIYLNSQHVWWQRRKTVETSIKKLKDSKQLSVSMYFTNFYLFYFLKAIYFLMWVFYDSLRIPM